MVLADALGARELGGPGWARPRAAEAPVPGPAGCGRCRGGPWWPLHRQAGVPRRECAMCLMFCPPLVRPDEPRTDQAHGKRRAHVCTRPWAWGGGPVGPVEGRQGVQGGGPGAPLTPPLAQGPSRNLLLNGKSYPTKVRLIRGGSLPPVKRRRMNWIDAPDDVFYMATEETRWGPSHTGGTAGGRGGRASSSRRCSALTGKSASCSRPRRPSGRPAGPTSPSPCARARPCRCGRPRPHPSTTSPLSLRTSRPARRRQPRPAPPAAARRPPRPTPPAPTARPVLVVPSRPHPQRRRPAPGQSARPRGGTLTLAAGPDLSFVFLFGRSGARGRPAPAPPRVAGGRSPVVFC